jgi:chromate transporter
MILIKLFLEFFKVSCFTFGGAYAAIPLIREAVLGNGWITEERLAYMIAVSESTPGPIIINLATYVGSDQAGFWGSLVATVAVVLPAYLVIMLVMVLLRNFIQNPCVRAVLQGLKPCVVGVVLATGVYMVLHSCFPMAQGQPAEGSAILITALLVVVQFVWRKITKKQLSPIGLILWGAVLGIVEFGF